MDESDRLMETAFEKFEAAKTLLKSGYYADAISRAYYAMFYASKALLSTKDIHPKTHRGVISQVWEHFVKKGLLDRELTKALTAAREDREDADYGILPEFTSEETEIIIKNTEKFLQRVKEILR